VPIAAVHRRPGMILARANHLSGGPGGWVPLALLAAALLIKPPSLSPSCPARPFGWLRCCAALGLLAIVWRGDQRPGQPARWFTNLFTERRTSPTNSGRYPGLGCYLGLAVQWGENRFIYGVGFQNSGNSLHPEVTGPAFLTHSHNLFAAESGKSNGVVPLALGVFFLGA